MNKLLLSLHVYIVLVLLVGCSSKNPTSPPPPNNAPIINSLLISSSSIPRNRTASFAVVVTDSDEDSLIYFWSATAGTFLGGNNSPQVTWIPPTSIADYTISLTIEDGNNRIDTSFTMSVTKAIYTFSGLVVNQAAAPISGVYVVIVDSDNGIDSVLTDTSGTYSFTDKPEGELSISYRPAIEIIGGMPNVKAKDTTMSLSDSNNILNFSLREINILYHDDGSRAEDWIFVGGASNDSTKYIFLNEAGSDRIIMDTLCYIPTNAQDIYCEVFGKAGPAVNDSCAVMLTLYINGSPKYYTVQTYFDTADYVAFPLFSFDWLPGNSMSIEIEFMTTYGSDVYPATNMEVYDVWIYSY